MQRNDTMLTKTVVRLRCADRKAGTYSPLLLKAQEAILEQQAAEKLETKWIESKGTI